MQFIVANVRTEVRSYVAPSSAALISVMLLDERLNYSKQQKLSQCQKLYLSKLTKEQ